MRSRSWLDGLIREGDGPETSISSMPNYDSFIRLIAARCDSDLLMMVRTGRSISTFRTTSVPTEMPSRPSENRLEKAIWPEF